MEWSSDELEEASQAAESIEVEQSPVFSTIASLKQSFASGYTFEAIRRQVFRLRMRYRAMVNQVAMECVGEEDDENSIETNVPIAPIQILGAGLIEKLS